MGIISRFADIMEANINAVLDKCEDPAKMIDQTLRKLNDELAEVKNETAAVMAEEKSAKRRLDSIQAEIDKYDSSARKAIQAGNDGDAKALLARKQELEAQKTTATSTYNVAKANADKMRQMYEKLNGDIATLNSRRETIKAQVSMAKAQDRVSKVASEVGKSNAVDTFSRMEAKAQKMLDESSARAELSADALASDSTADLADKYQSGTDKSVDDELARMKAEMGIN